MSATVELIINSEKLDVAYDYDAGEPMVWRYADGSGHPGSPPSCGTTQVVLVRPLGPFADAMARYLTALDTGSTVPEEELTKLHREIVDLYQRVDLTNLAENLFGLEKLDDLVMEKVDSER
jgi:hypothetical protein